MAESITDYFDALNYFADRCRESVMHYFKSGFKVEQKPDGSLVTDGDKETEKLFRSLVREKFPTHSIFGEEFGIEGSSEYQWIIDPIDGTREFTRGLPTFGTIIALYKNGKPLVATHDHGALDLRLAAGAKLGCWMNGERLTRRNLRHSPIQAGCAVSLPSRDNFIRDGSLSENDLLTKLQTSFSDYRTFRSCYGHTLVVLGSLDLGIEWAVKSWDLAATPLLITESGGEYMGWEKTQYSYAVFGVSNAVAKAREVLGLGLAKNA